MGHGRREIRFLVQNLVFRPPSPPSTPPLERQKVTSSLEPYFGVLKLLRHSLHIIFFLLSNTYFRPCCAQKFLVVFLIVYFSTKQISLLPDQPASARPGGAPGGDSRCFCHSLYLQRSGASFFWEKRSIKLFYCTSCFRLGRKGRVFLVGT